MMVSLPTRERGLKFVPGVAVPGVPVSLPKRERGLKLHDESDWKSRAKELIELRLK